MKTSYTISLLIILLTATNIFARPLPVENFKYKKDITLPSKMGESQIVKVLLDEEFYKHSFYGDLRLTLNGEIVPYRIQNAEEISKYTEKLKPDLLFTKKDEMEIYVLELPKLPEGMSYSKLTVTSSYDYETSITLKLGDNPDSFSETKNVFLYKYGSQTSGEIDLGNTKYRYVRLEVENGSNLKFPSVTRSKENKHLYFEKKHQVPNPLLEENAVLFSFPNENQTSFQKLKLSFEEKNWERMITVRGKINKKEWDTVFQGTINHDEKEGNFAEIPISSPLSSEFTIQIEDGENQTLHLKEVVTVQPLEEILFFADNLTKDSHYSLYYGNPYQWPANFDPYTFPSSDDLREKTPLEGKLTKEVENAEFGYNLIYPPMSGYITTGLFYLGIGTLLVFIFSILRSKRLVASETV
ncbi:hypothetical protein CH354_10935 [Leptospira levettii]|uniref:hypothetical protein n=1 Tax=Leptospira levettii TaxID=2023178 RepID=UPI000C2A7AB0|nr:hypothetical protein [Leptospira levettii]MCW7472821.1 hypothetical protein [Leptospira levettii]PJZ37549.1 hypothetical protein CH354_10935 [Leptospira levettii]PJZ89560.1 hypothetical protein CH368_05725 [Leptospira levettii]PKA00360.1 hypothetical protein CH369_07665 [Leptospira levettii]